MSEHLCKTCGKYAGTHACNAKDVSNFSMQKLIKSQNDEIQHLRQDRDEWKDSTITANERFRLSEEAKEQNNTLALSNQVLREALQNVLDGNYPSPRTDRGKRCKHEKYYWEDCTQCVDDYIQEALSTTPNAEKWIRKDTLEEVAYRYERRVWGKCGTAYEYHSDPAEYHPNLAEISNEVIPLYRIKEITK